MAQNDRNSLESGTQRRTGAPPSVSPRPATCTEQGRAHPVRSPCDPPSLFQNTWIDKESGSLLFSTWLTILTWPDHEAPPELLAEVAGPHAATCQGQVLGRHTPQVPCQVVCRGSRLAVFAARPHGARRSMILSWGGTHGSNVARGKQEAIDKFGEAGG